MSEERVKRKLSAVLCADVVGYSRLMGEEEAATLQALQNSEAEIIYNLVSNCTVGLPMDISRLIHSIAQSSFSRDMHS